MSASANKRRKLSAPGTPQAAVSAVSAVAARRRLAASAAAEASASTPEQAGASASSNPFSPLQAPQRRERARSPKKAGQGSSTARGQESNAEAATSRSKPAQPRTVTYSSFTLTKHNHRITADGAVEISLEDCERFLLVGSFGIRVLSGEVTVAGAALRPSETTHWVHAPHCHALPVLRTAGKTRLELRNEPEADNLRRLGRLSPLFRGLWNDTPAHVSEPPLTFQFLGTSEDAPKKSMIRELVSPPEWNKKLASLVEAASGREPLVALVCGPKSAGKSTFSKLLTNRLLTGASAEAAQAVAKGVAVLELDPGQPEYAPPGTLCLVHVTQPNLGVPFTHPSLDDGPYRVVRCHSLASVNAASAVDLHLECAMDLYEHYRQTLRGCPLLVNTPGWILSQGLELLVQLITNIRPAEVVYLSEEGPAETVETLGGATKNTFTALPSQTSEFKSRTAAHLREMQTMSYFHSLRRDGSEGKGRLGWTPSALSSARPLAVRYAGRCSGVLGILRYDYQLPPDLIAEAINGMVLAIVEIEDPRAFRQLAQGAAAHGSEDASDSDTACRRLVAQSPEGIPFIPNPDDLTLDPRHSRTIGLGLIRGVDVPRRSLQVLTPTPAAKIADARSRGSSIVLVHGNFEAPTWSYTEHLHDQAGQDEGLAQAELEVTDEGTSEDESDVEPDPYASDAVPWVEVLRGSEKRPVGSRVWRVRRDLGRNAGD